MTESPNIKPRMESLLTAAFSPSLIEIVDDSHKHAGHAGAREGGETHFRVTIISDYFTGKSKVNRQREVYAAVKPLMEERIHALQLFTLTPDEAAN